MRTWGTCGALALGLGWGLGCSGVDREEDSPLGVEGGTGLPDADSTGSEGDAGSSAPATTDPDDGASEGLDDGVAEADDGEQKFDIPGGEGGGPGGNCDHNVDIVFVMDVSTTMGPFFDRLEQEIAVVQEALDDYDLPAEPHYGLVVFVDDYQVSNDGAPYTDIEQLRTDFEMWNQFTSSNQQITIPEYGNQTFPENSLDAIYAAAEQFDWRPTDTTLRVVIHTTDDGFWNGPTSANGIQIQHGYAETVTRLQTDEIRFFTFAARLGGSLGFTDVEPGFFTPYMGMPPIPESTDGVAWDIDAVLADTASLADAITTAIEDNYCEPYPPVG